MECRWLTSLEVSPCVSHLMFLEIWGFEWKGKVGVMITDKGGTLTAL